MGIETSLVAVRHESDRSNPAGIGKWHRGNDGGVGRRRRLGALGTAAAEQPTEEPADRIAPRLFSGKLGCRGLLVRRGLGRLVVDGRDLDLELRRVGAFLGGKSGGKRIGAA